MRSIITTLTGLALLVVLPAAAQFNNPNGIIFDSKGHLWLANAGENNVLELKPSKGTILTTITDGVNNPTRLVFDSTGRLWVTNLGNNSVTVYRHSGSGKWMLVKTITNQHISRPLGLAVDAYGDLYVADNSTNSVVAFNIDDGFVESLTNDKQGYEFIAPGVLVIHGQNIYAGFGPCSVLVVFGCEQDEVISYNVGEFLTRNPKEGTVYSASNQTGPTGVAFDKHGNVYVSEYTTPSWVKYSPSGKVRLEVQDGVNGPEGIALDSSGNVYVSNSAANNITVYNPSGKLIRTLK
jgi:sugar lactone lactonase YvrE